MTVSRRAFFDRPVAAYLRGGTHLALEAILRQQEVYLALRRPRGLYGGPAGKLYFPHGEFRWGEEVGACVARLVKRQAGLHVRRHHVLDVWSWINPEQEHWHLVVVAMAEVHGQPRLARGVSEIVRFGAARLPDDFGWWSVEDLREAVSRAPRPLSS